MMAGRSTPAGSDRPRGVLLSGVVAAALSAGWAVLHAPIVVTAGAVVIVLSLISAIVTSGLALGIGWFRALVTSPSSAVLVDICLVALVIRTAARHAIQRADNALPTSAARQTAGRSDHQVPRFS